jgi:hypothetical protein
MSQFVYLYRMADTEDSLHLSRAHFGKLAVGCVVDDSQQHRSVDTFFTRAGDVVSAGFVGLGQVIALTTSAFAGINVLLTIVWLWVAARIAREHRRRTV